jgi:hypothetical protein
MVEFPTERTFYDPITHHLQSLGFTGFSEVDVGRKYPDILCWIDDQKFVIQVRFDKPEKLSKIAAETYPQTIKANTPNYIILLYKPEMKRVPLNIIKKKFEEIALRTPITIASYTEPLSDVFEEISVENYFKELLKKVKQKVKYTSFNSVIKHLNDLITGLSYALREKFLPYLEKPTNFLVGQFELFLALSDIEKTREEINKLKEVSIDLLSYILVNQIFFYHIFSRLTGRIKELPTINNLETLGNYFKEILSIDYQPIYEVDLIFAFKELSKNPYFIENINEVIQAIKMLKPENLEGYHFGSLFQELLPKETQKRLAAFYTHPVGAEILATLSIDKWDEKIFDPACGSGNLLVAAYRRKMDLYKEGKVTIPLEEVHKNFVEKDITGIDIMPFASHLSAIHLISQNILIETNKVRITGGQNSLVLSPEQKVENLKKSIQTTLKGLGIKLEGAKIVSLKEYPKEFVLDYVDTIIMNPPFTDKRRLPESIRRQVSKDILSKVGRANYWVYFVFLSDKFLKKNGKMGLVVPYNFFRGKDSEPIRKYMFPEKYKIRYVIKTTKEPAFSVGAKFRDYLVILDKIEKRNYDEKIGFVYLKKSIYEYEKNMEKAREVAEKIRKVKVGKNYSDEEITILWEEWKNIKENWQKFILPFITTCVPDDFGEILSFMWKIMNKIKKRKYVFSAGLSSVPKGLSKALFINRPLSKSRERNSFLILRGENKEEIKFVTEIFKKGFSLNKQKIKKGLRTLASVNKIYITNMCDYVIKEDFKEFKDILKSLNLTRSAIRRKWPKELVEKESKIILSNRLDISSPNTCLLSFYSDEPLTSMDTFFLLKEKGLNEDDYKILCLYFNSVVYILQFLYSRRETRGAWIGITHEELDGHYILDVNSLSNDAKNKLLQLFEEIKDKEFPSLYEQFKEFYPLRVKLDDTFLKVLGFNEEERKEIIEKSYRTIVKEIDAMKEIMKV